MGRAGLTKGLSVPKHVSTFTYITYDVITPTQLAWVASLLCTVVAILDIHIAISPAGSSWYFPWFTSQLQVFDITAT